MFLVARLLIGGNPIRLCPLNFPDHIKIDSDRYRKFYADPARRRVQAFPRKRGSHRSLSSALNYSAEFILRVVTYASRNWNVITRLWVLCIYDRTEWNTLERKFRTNLKQWLREKINFSVGWSGVRLGLYFSSSRDIVIIAYGRDIVKLLLFDVYLFHLLYR